MTFNLQVSK